MDFSTVWTEKYRPHTLTDVIGQEHVRERLIAFIKDGSIPHLLFAGPAGVGKTTAAICVAKDLYGEDWKANFMETNASDERGIDVVRNKIKDFARTRPLGADFKIIFLDECDALTRDAQQALRRTMESYSATCRFILSANYSSKIIDPIQSRCAVFRFGKLKSKDVNEYLERVVLGEKIVIDDDAKKAIIELSKGDLRKVTNLLQTSAALGDVTQDSVYSAASMAKPEQVEEILNLALSKKFMDARAKLFDLMVTGGLSGEDLIKEIHSVILTLDIPEKQKANLIDKIGEYEFRIVEGANEHIQLSALLAQMAYGQA